MQTELRYERRFLPLPVPLGLGPGYSEVRVAEGTLHVKMGVDHQCRSDERARVLRGRALLGWAVVGQWIWEGPGGIDD